MPADALPQSWREAPSVLLTPVAAELGPDWAPAFDESSYVALAAQGLMRAMRPGEEVVRLPLPDATNPLIHRSDLICGQRRGCRRGRSCRFVTFWAQARPFWSRTATTARSASTERKRASRAITCRHSRGALRSTRRVPATRSWRRTSRSGRSSAAAGARLAVASAMGSLSVQRRSLANTPSKQDLCDELIRLPDRHPG